MATSTQLSRAKRKLRIAATDTADDAYIGEIIDDCTAKVAHLVGVSPSFDFEAAGPERALLMEAVFYAFNDAADEFQLNYAADIAACRRANLLEDFNDSR